MKENNFLIVLIITVAVLVSSVSIFYFTKDKNSGPEKKSDTKSVGDIVEQPVQEKKEEKKEEVDPEITQKDLPDKAIKMKISSGDVSYIAKKTFIGKAPEDVVGKTDKILGEGWISQDSKTAFLEASLSFFDIKSDSTKRDDDTKYLFRSDKIKIGGLFEGLPDIRSKKGTILKTPLQLIINDIKKEAVFEISVKMNSDNSLKADGEAEIFMSDFGITPPSLLNVFTVDDKVKITFDISASPIDE